MSIILYLLLGANARPSYIKRHRQGHAGKTGAIRFHPDIAKAPIFVPPSKQITTNL